MLWFCVFCRRGSCVEGSVWPENLELRDMSEVFPFLVYGVTFGFSAAVVPGPLLTYLISQTLRNGWRRTVPAAFSPLLSDGPIAILVLLILIHVPPWLELVLKFCGGLFLLYLAFLALRAWGGYGSEGKTPAQSARQTVLKAAVVNLLNPNPYLGWGLVLGPLLLTGWRENPGYGIALLAGFYSTMVTSTAAILLAFSVARGIGPKVNRILIAISACALAGFGIYQLSSGTIALVSR